jgi:inner membrane protein
MKIEINDNEKWQHSFTVKMFVLAFMGLILLIPLEMIKSMIGERQETSEAIKREISFQWAGPQTISGPVLNIPLIIYPSGKDPDPYRSVFHILPETLDIRGNIKTEKRHRSIYEAVVYTSDVNLSGKFVIPEISTGEKSDILWDEAYYSLGISDNRGLKGGVSLKADSIVTEAAPGLKDTDLFTSGITFRGDITECTENVGFSLDLSVSGSESILFTPLGKTTNVILTSTWYSPGFVGNFLPFDRVIDDLSLASFLHKT